MAEDEEEARELLMKGQVTLNDLQLTEPYKNATHNIESVDLPVHMKQDLLANFNTFLKE